MYDPQETAIRRGIDILVGTPGRILDLVEKGKLTLNKVLFPYQQGLTFILSFSSSFSLSHSFFSLSPVSYFQLFLSLTRSFLFPLSHTSSSFSLSLVLFSFPCLILLALSLSHSFFSLSPVSYFQLFLSLTRSFLFPLSHTSSSFSLSLVLFSFPCLILPALSLSHSFFSLSPVSYFQLFLSLTRSFLFPLSHTSSSFSLSLVLFSFPCLILPALSLSHSFFSLSPVSYFQLFLSLTRSFLFPLSHTSSSFSLSLVLFSFPCLILPALSLSHSFFSLSPVSYFQLFLSLTRSFLFPLSHTSSSFSLSLVLFSFPCLILPALSLSHSFFSLSPVSYFQLFLSLTRSFLFPLSHLPALSLSHSFFSLSLSHTSSSFSLSLVLFSFPCLILPALSLSLVLFILPALSLSHSFFSLSPVSYFQLFLSLTRSFLFPLSHTSSSFSVTHLFSHSPPLSLPLFL